jgi:hypothetical protein
MAKIGEQQAGRAEAESPKAAASIGRMPVMIEAAGADGEGAAGEPEGDVISMGQSPWVASGRRIRRPISIFQ